MNDDLWELAAAWVECSDQAAARALMDALYPRVAGIVANHCPRGADRGDLVQEVFLRVFRGLHRFRPEQPLEHWVSRIALNVCRTRGRAQARRPEWRWSDLTDGERAAFDAARAEDVVGPDAAIDAEDARSLMRRLVEALGTVDRQIVTLLHLEGRTVEEIALLMGMARTAVRVRAFRARLKLRKAIMGLEKGKA